MMPKTFSVRVKKRSKPLLFLAAVLIPACSPNRFFYYPNRILYTEPREFSIDYDVHEFPSKNGKVLKAIVFPTAQPPKGTIVHFHGNFRNLSNHVSQSYYLTRHGFDVMIFDYQGFGASEGKPSPENTVEDGLAAVEYALEWLRTPLGNVGILGQSLGASVGIVTTARSGKVKALVAESPFSSYRKIAQKTVRHTPILWLTYPFLPFLIHSAQDPILFVAQVSPAPILFIHGLEDRVVPPAMSRALHEKALEPKQLWLIPKAGHLSPRRTLARIYEEKIAAFFTQAFSSTR